MSRNSAQEIPDFSRWRCFYPAYLNSTKTVAQGRKVAKEFCVENPTPKEIGYVCSALLKFPTVVENKAYSKDFRERGRIRVQMTDADGQPLNPECKSRIDLLKKCGELIPTLPTRQGKGNRALPNAPQLLTSESKGNTPPMSTGKPETIPSPVVEPTPAPGSQAPAANKNKKNNRNRRR